MAPPGMPSGQSQSASVVGKQDQRHPPHNRKHRRRLHNAQHNQMQQHAHHRAPAQNMTLKHTHHAHHLLYLLYLRHGKIRIKMNREISAHQDWMGNPRMTVMTRGTNMSHKMQHHAHNRVPKHIMTLKHAHHAQHLLYLGLLHRQILESIRIKMTRQDGITETTTGTNM